MASSVHSPDPFPDRPCPDPTRGQPLSRFVPTSWDAAYPTPGTGAVNRKIGWIVDALTCSKRDRLRESSQVTVFVFFSTRIFTGFVLIFPTFLAIFQGQILTGPAKAGPKAVPPVRRGQAPVVFHRPARKYWLWPGGAVCSNASVRTRWSKGRNFRYGSD